MVFYSGAVVITKEIGPGQDHSMTLQIQVENVVCSLKPCSMCQPRTELNFGNPHAIIYVQVVVRDLQNCSVDLIFSTCRYATDYGMFRFCIADTEHDWREGTEQYRFIEHCLASVDRQKQPWLIFAAHRVLGYSSSSFYAEEGSFEEPMGRESLQKLWQKYRVDIAFYGHVHNYERTCPIYQVLLTQNDI